MKTIVIVDDEFGLSDVLAATLSEVGFRVWTAANGLRGLEIMAEHPPDLIILDYMMPLLDGPGVLAAMRVNPKLASVPIVLMSAMAESVVRAHCDGYVAFLRKPFGFETLLGVVENILEPAGRSGPAGSGPAGSSGAGSYGA
jgi:CheY-like chemotaxis protein